MLHIWSSLSTTYYVVHFHVPSIDSESRTVYIYFPFMHAYVTRVKECYWPNCNYLLKLEKFSFHCWKSIAFLNQLFTDLDHFHIVPNV